MIGERGKVGEDEVVMGKWSGREWRGRKWKEGRGTVEVAGG